jgi:hypothetical protein
MTQFLKEPASPRTQLREPFAVQPSVEIDALGPAFTAPSDALEAPYSLVNRPPFSDEADDGTEEDDETEDPREARKRVLMAELGQSLGDMEQHRDCPVCGQPTQCIGSNGLGSRFICGNLHIISIDTARLNT